MDEPLPPSESKLALDPIGHLFSESWRVYKERFVVLIELLILPMVLIGVGELLLSYGIPWLFLGLILMAIGYVMAIAAYTGVIFSLSKGIGVGESYRSGFAIFWPAIWIGLLVYFSVVGGMILLIIPGIVFSIWFMFGNYVLVVEGKRGGNAMSQSREYVRGYWWPLFGRYLLLGIPMGAIFMIVYFPTFFILGRVAGIFVSFALITLFTSFSLVYIYTLYKNIIAIKPAVAATQAKTNKGFYVIPVIGVLGAIAYCIVLVAFVLPLVIAARNAAKTPAITVIAPAAGAVWPLGSAQVIQSSRPRRDVHGYRAHLSSQRCPY